MNVECLTHRTKMGSPAQNRRAKLVTPRSVIEKLPPRRRNSVLTERPPARYAGKLNMSHAALAGIRVIEIGNFMAAPFCTMQLADLGADVVKIENPDGGEPNGAKPPRPTAASRRHL